MTPDIPPRSPETFTWLTYLWVVGLSVLGGFVAFMQKMRDGHVRVWNFTELFGEVATSAFAGVLTFFMCESANLAPLTTAAFVGISGHMGSRAIHLLENYFTRKYPEGPTIAHEQHVTVQKDKNEPKP